ncbi:unnamed protein product [Amoebophrya sp. A120]|nr:unnamed protein product [Amoebophrya sp. A120]|eukprot:GSA120T00001570001.1
MTMRLRQRLLLVALVAFDVGPVIQWQHFFSPVAGALVTAEKPGNIQERKLCPLRWPQERELPRVPKRIDMLRRDVTVALRPFPAEMLKDEPGVRGGTVTASSSGLPSFELFTQQWYNIARRSVELFHGNFARYNKTLVQSQRSKSPARRARAKARVSRSPRNKTNKKSKGRVSRSPRSKRDEKRDAVRAPEPRIDEEVDVESDMELADEWLEQWMSFQRFQSLRELGAKREQSKSSWEAVTPDGEPAKQQNMFFAAKSIKINEIRGAEEKEEKVMRAEFAKKLKRAVEKAREYAVDDVSVSAGALAGLRGSGSSIAGEGRGGPRVNAEDAARSLAVTFWMAEAMWRHYALHYTATHPYAPIAEEMGKGGPTSSQQEKSVLHPDMLLPKITALLFELFRPQLEARVARKEAGRRMRERQTKTDTLSTQQQQGQRAGGRRLLFPRPFLLYLGGDGFGSLPREEQDWGGFDFRGAAVYVIPEAVFAGGSAPRIVRGGVASGAGAEEEERAVLVPLRMQPHVEAPSAQANAHVLTPLPEGLFAKVEMPNPAPLTVGSSSLFSSSTSSRKCLYGLSTTASSPAASLSERAPARKSPGKVRQREVLTGSSLVVHLVRPMYYLQQIARSHLIEKGKLPWSGLQGKFNLTVHAQTLILLDKILDEEDLQSQIDAEAVLERLAKTCFVGMGLDVDDQEVEGGQEDGVKLSPAASSKSRERFTEFMETVKRALLSPLPWIPKGSDKMTEEEKYRWLQQLTKEDIFVSVVMEHNGIASSSSLGQDFEEKVAILPHDDERTAFFAQGLARSASSTSYSFATTPLVPGPHPLIPGVAATTPAVEDGRRLQTKQDIAKILATRDMISSGLATVALPLALPTGEDDEDEKWDTVILKNLLLDASTTTAAREAGEHQTGDDTTGSELGTSAPAFFPFDSEDQLREYMGEKLDEEIETLRDVEMEDAQVEEMLSSSTSSPTVAEVHVDDDLATRLAKMNVGTNGNGKKCSRGQASMEFGSGSALLAGPRGSTATAGAMSSTRGTSTSHLLAAYFPNGELTFSDARAPHVLDPSVERLEEESAAFLAAASVEERVRLDRVRKNDREALLQWQSKWHEQARSEAVAGERSAIYGNQMKPTQQRRKKRGGRKQATSRSPSPTTRRQAKRSEGKEGDEESRRKEAERRAALLAAKKQKVVNDLTRKLGKFRLVLRELRKTAGILEGGVRANWQGSHIKMHAEGGGAWTLRVPHGQGSHR